MKAQINNLKLKKEKIDILSYLNSILQDFDTSFQDEFKLFNSLRYFLKDRYTVSCVAGIYGFFCYIEELKIILALFTRKKFNRMGVNYKRIGKVYNKDRIFQCYAAKSTNYMINL